MARGRHEAWIAAAGPLASAIAAIALTALALAFGPADDLLVRRGATRWTGRPGYPVRATVGVALARSLYSIPRGGPPTLALVREHTTHREAIAASVRRYRFAAKLRTES